MSTPLSVPSGLGGASIVTGCVAGHVWKHRWSSTRPAAPFPSPAEGPSGAGVAGRGSATTL